MGSYRISHMKILSDFLETALANLALEVEGREVENEIACETSKDSALMYTVMELRDELICLKSH